MLALRDGYNHVGERMRALEREPGNEDSKLNIRPLKERPETTLTYHLTVESVHICDGGKKVWGDEISDDDFVRVRRPKQQIANVAQRIFRMSNHELAFVERVLTRKPNLQIYRTHQTANMGDFVIIGHPEQTAHQKKTAPTPSPSPNIGGGGFCSGFLSPPPMLGEGLGVGARSVVCDLFRLAIIDPSDSEYIVGWVVELKIASAAAHAGVQLSRAKEAADHFKLDEFRAITGNSDEMMAILTRGRGAWE